MCVLFMIDVSIAGCYCSDGDGYTYASVLCIDDRESTSDVKMEIIMSFWPCITINSKPITPSFASLIRSPRKQHRDRTCQKGRV